eukprot:4760850-Pyramimonas_sp.AAC.1
MTPPLASLQDAGRRREGTSRVRGVATEGAPCRPRAEGGRRRGEGFLEAPLLLRRPGPRL